MVVGPLVWWLYDRYVPRPDAEVERAESETSRDAMLADDKDANEQYPLLNF